MAAQATRRGTARAASRHLPACCAAVALRRVASGRSQTVCAHFKVRVQALEQPIACLLTAHVPSWAAAAFIQSVTRNHCADPSLE
ncbi:hypothetical protein KFE25_012240 [Diacronema lutheri]|uniref:Uncharacterized protein n=1 Tax=Diacronema lutheri TaxID=2081491 RepID=A0A8J5XGC2_DIALT|nr:hypothetical protein KFE25_012240 [Diacronema lutheri]